MDEQTATTTPTRAAPRNDVTQRHRRWWGDTPLWISPYRTVIAPRILYGFLRHHSQLSVITTTLLAILIDRLNNSVNRTYCF